MVRQKTGVQPLMTTQPAVSMEVDGAASASTAGLSNAADLLRAEVMDRVGAGQIELPLLPQVASQVLTLAGSANTDAAELSGLIHRDPALAGQVLRIANSPAYMPRMPIVSLQQAVARLGLNTVTEIALVASMQAGTFKVPGYEPDLKRLWRHAVASALFGKEIARVRRSNVEAAFLCGLLHAVGKPALLQVVADVQRSLTKSHVALPGGPASATVRSVVSALLDELHVGVGLRIAEIWGLPRPVVSAIGAYTSYESIPGASPEAVITCLADRLATNLTEPARFDDQQLREHPVFAHLNLYPDDVAGLLAKRAKVSEVVDSMTT